MTPSGSEDELVAEQDLAPLSPWWHVPLPGTVCVPKLQCLAHIINDDMMIMIMVAVKVLTANTY